MRNVSETGIICKIKSCYVVLPTKKRKKKMSPYYTREHDIFYFSQSLCCPPKRLRFDLKTF